MKISTAFMTIASMALSVSTTAAQSSGPLQCQNPTQELPLGCLGNLIQVKTSSNISYIGQYGFVPPAQNGDNHIGSTLSLTPALALANTFAITANRYGQLFLNVSQSHRYAFWSPATQVGGADESDYYAWLVNFLGPRYGSTMIQPTFDLATRDLTLTVTEYGSYGELKAVANMVQVCTGNGGNNNGTVPYVVVSDMALDGCASATLVWL